MRGISSQRQIMAKQEVQLNQDRRVAELIDLKQAKPYNEATALLKDLRDLAEYRRISGTITWLYLTL